MSNLLKQFHKDETGQDLIEYALIAAMIALACVSAMTSLASSIGNEFNNAGNALS